MLSLNDQERYSVYVVAKLINVFYIGKGLGEFFCGHGMPCPYMVGGFWLGGLVTDPLRTSSSSP